MIAFNPFTGQFEVTGTGTAGAAYLPQVTALTGDLATTLDGQPTVGLPLLTMYQVVIGGVLKSYQIQTGNAGVVPADYNAGTNNVSWVEVG